MIAITVSVFGAREAKSRTHGALLSGAFVLGIAALFTPLGIVAALTGGLFGSLLANPIVVWGLALVFVVLALSMFGAFDLALPSSVQNRLVKVGGIGFKGAFALGFVNGLIAAPCTGPVLGFLLGWIASTKRVGFGGIALFSYSLGLGVLFWIVGTFAVSLPKSGRWLEWVKSVFGIVMIVMAVYFLRDQLPFARPTTRSALLGGLAVGGIVLGLALGAVHLSFHSANAVRIRKAVAVALTVVGASLGLFWMEALPPGAKIQWLDDYAAAKRLADEENRPLLVDFGASWCGACGELDRKTFSDPRVVHAVASARFVAVHVDLSPQKDSKEKRATLASYNHPGLPLVVVHHGTGEEAARIAEFVEADDFLLFLQKARN